MDRRGLTVGCDCQWRCLSAYAAYVGTEVAGCKAHTCEVGCIDKYGGWRLTLFSYDEVGGPDWAVCE
jgi:hypothetical protein